MKCFYHTDLDGKCAGAIVKHLHPKCEMFEIDYGDEFPFEKLPALPETVFMVDFSLQPPELMLKLDKSCRLIWIDHHKSVLERVNAVFDAEGKKVPLGSRAVDVAGCELTWKYLYPKVPMPLAVKLLGRYDVWDHDYMKEVLAFQYAFRSLDTDPNNVDFWVRWLVDDVPDVKFQQVVHDGEAILRYIAKSYETYMKANAFVTIFEGYTCLTVNCGPPFIGSQLFDSHWDPEKYQVMLGFESHGDKWTVRLYTTRPEIDVGEIAARHGGGGHKQAAGFVTEKLPYIHKDKL